MRPPPVDPSSELLPAEYRELTPSPPAPLYDVFMNFYGVVLLPVPLGDASFNPLSACGLCEDRCVVLFMVEEEFPNEDIIPGAIDCSCYRIGVDLAVPAIEASADSFGVYLGGGCC